MAIKKKAKKKAPTQKRSSSAGKTLKTKKKTAKKGPAKKGACNPSAQTGSFSQPKLAETDHPALCQDFFNHSPVSLWEEDITELRDYIASLRSSGVRDLSAFLAKYPEEIIKCTELVKVIAVNNATLRLYEAPDQKTLMQGLSQVFIDKSLDSFRDIVLALADGAKAYECETVNKTLTGRTLSVLLKWSLIENDEKESNRILISVVDLTERKNVEETLRKNQENLKRAERIGKIGNWEWNVLTNEIVWSDEVYRIYGMDPARNKPSYEIVVQTVAPEDQKKFVDAVESAVRDGAHFEGEYRMIGLDGVERFTHTTGEVIRDQDGNPLSMFGIVQDITDRKQIEVALRSNQNLLETVFEAVPT